MTRAADALQERRDAMRRAELADEIDVADIDTELERGRRDERAQLAGLELALGVEPMLLGETAVMRRHDVLAEALGEVPRGALGEPTRIDEDERRLVGTDQLGEPIVDLGPDLVGHDRLERRARQLEREIALAHMTLVDDRAIGVGPTRQVLGHPIERLRRRGNADPNGASRAKGGEPLERKREMGAALVAGERMDLVDDDGAHRREHAPPRCRGQQDIERFRRRDEDVRRLPPHSGALALGRVPAAHHRANRHVGEQPRRRIPGEFPRAAPAGSFGCRSTTP